MRPLSNQEEVYCHEYLIDLDPLRATTAAFPNLSGGEQAYKRKAKALMNKAGILNRIKVLKNARTTRLNLSVDGVIHKISEIIDRCMQAEAVYDRQGEPTGEYRFDAGNALKGLELLGKHFGIWLERYQVSDPVTEVLAKKLDTVPEEDLRKFLKEASSGKNPTNVINVNRN